MKVVVKFGNALGFAYKEIKSESGVSIEANEQ